VAEHAPSLGGKTVLDPSSLSPADLARLLTKAGGQAISEGMVDRDIADGAPTNADGTVNLVHYTAWLVRMTAQGG